MTGDHVTLIEPNGVQRTKSLTSRGMSIGRGEDNDLVVGYAAVSRYHAQVTSDQGYYYVTDLNSGNGTYLDSDRLAPNQPTLWNPRQVLRVGDVQIHLEQSGLADSHSETFVGWFAEQDKPKRSGAIKWLLVTVAIAFIIVALILLVFFLTA
jgi:predicted component of type VI protein secretion system